MAYSEDLAKRLFEFFDLQNNVEAKEMMGGLTIMLNGKMCVGIIKDELMCRINPDMQASALEKPGCRIMDFTKKPMKGYVMVAEDALRTKSEMAFWVNLAIDFNSLAKASKKKKPATKN